MATVSDIFMCFVAAAIIVHPTIMAQLTPDYYEQVCPEALPTIREVVKKAIEREARMGASLLRLHFHDCFVNGCDGSNLLDDTPTFKGEKTAGPNLNSLRGFDVVDEIKATVDSICDANVVSCADILAIAARDSVSILGGPWYEVVLGRRDSESASLSAPNVDIPSPSSNFSTLLSNFQNHGLGLKDLVVLSGAHTLGLARCVVFRSRIYNDTNIDSHFATTLKQSCPLTGGDNNTSALDGTTAVFDKVYFQDLLQKKGLLHSDQELLSGGDSQSNDLVQYYSDNTHAFWEDFGDSMVKMGNIKPLTGSNGQIRMNCRKPN